eukprot:Clim_evm41s109 gene=Clim_evmTU41s109
MNVNQIGAALGMGASNSEGASYIGRSLSVRGGSYTVQKVIAEGGFGYVFQCRGSDGRTYAVKRILAPREKQKEIEREIEVMVALAGHPRIARLIDSNKQPNASVMEYFVVMDFYPGGGVLDIMNARLRQHKRLSERETMQIFCDTVEAVAAMHLRAEPIVHRDLKVENILVDGQRRFVVCDFGSAQYGTVTPNKGNIEHLDEDIKAHTTMQYRAPEQCDLYSFLPIGPGVDIWALGCILYKLCFFEGPFEKGPLQIIGNEWRWPDKPERFASDRVRTLIHFMLQPDPNIRPNITEVAQAAFKVAGKQNPIRLQPGKCTEHYAKGGTHAPQGSARSMGSNSAPKAQANSALYPEFQQLSISDRKSAAGIKVERRRRGHSPNTPGQFGGASGGMTAPTPGSPAASVQITAQLTGEGSGSPGAVPHQQQQRPMFFDNAFANGGGSGGGTTSNPGSASTSDPFGSSAFGDAASPTTPGSAGFADAFGSSAFGPDSFAGSPPPPQQRPPAPAQEVAKRPTFERSTSLHNPGDLAGNYLAAAPAAAGRGHHRTASEGGIRHHHMQAQRALSPHAPAGSYVASPDALSEGARGLSPNVPPGGRNPMAGNPYMSQFQAQGQAQGYNDSSAGLNSPRMLGAPTASNPYLGTVRTTRTLSGNSIKETESNGDLIDLGRDFKGLADDEFDPLA